MPVFLLIILVEFLRADFLQLKKVEVVGNKDIQTEEIEKLVLAQLTGKYFFIIPKSNLFLFKKDTLTQELLKDLPRIESLEISKGLNGMLKIILQERRGDFVWCSASEVCYLMSNNGLVFTEAKAAEMAGKIIFKGNLPENPLLQNFATEAGMANYLKAIEILQNAGFQVLEIGVELGDKVVFKTTIGNIILNPEEDLSVTVPNAVILINDIKTKNPSAQFNYIDARFGNKVFYKLIH